MSDSVFVLVSKDGSLNDVSLVDLLRAVAAVGRGQTLKVVSAKAEEA